MVLIEKNGSFLLPNHSIKSVGTYFAYFYCEIKM